MPHSALASVMIFFVLLSSVVHPAEPSERAASAMVTLNSSFIKAHKAAREINLAKGGPVVLLRSGYLVLFRDGKETKVKAIPPVYNTYKTFAHIPPAIYLMLGPPGVGELDGARLDELRAYREKMDHVEKVIDATGLTHAALLRQKKIFFASKAFLDKVIENKKVSKDELLAYTRSMTPWIKANIADAAKAQIDGMHRQMMKWKKELSADEWQQLRVCIKGAVLARDNNLAKKVAGAQRRRSAACLYGNLLSARPDADANRDSRNRPRVGDRDLR